LIELGVNPNVKRISAKVKRLRGQPVCVVLNDGSYYVGWITGIKKNEFILSANKGQGKLNHTSSRHWEKAMVSGLFPALGSLFGGAGGANVLPTPTGAASADSGASGGFGWLGGLTGFMGFMQKAIPMFRMGYGMVKTIMPLFGGLKA
jgi:hypothetical protein